MRAEEMHEIANSMGEHIFQVGQMVAYRKASGPYAPPGTYIVTAHLPESDGEPQYRIKHSSEGYERHAQESDLSLPPGETSDGAP
jgi:hypothetical protein